MQKWIKQLKENKWIHYSIILIIGILLSIQLKEIEVSLTHDGNIHMMRIFGVQGMLENGQIPPVLDEVYCNGYGYATNLFYPQLVTYGPLLMNIFSPSYGGALKLFGALCMILSGIAMYAFIYEITKKRGIALFAAIIYLVAPYKVADVYRRYAIGEFAAFIFLPLTFLGLYNLIEGDKKKHYFITIGAAGLLLTHTVTTVYTAIFCIAYMLFNWRKLKDIKIWKKIGVNLVFILCISMLFWLPLLEAKQSADYAIFNDATMRTSGDYAANNTIEWYQFIQDKGEEFGTTFIIGISTLILIVFIFYGIKNIDKKYKDTYIIFIIFALVSLVMCTKFFPWKIMPSVLCKLQYPWRMEGFFIFFVSFIAGINLFIILQKGFKGDISKIVVLLIFIAMAITETNYIMSQFYRTEEGADKRSEERIQNAIDGKIIMTHWNINRDYLPLRAIQVQSTYMNERENRTYVLEGEATISKEEKQKLTTTLQVTQIEENTLLEFPYLYYPGYTIMLQEGEKQKSIKAEESPNGYVACRIENRIEEANITVKFEPTILTKISYVVSILSLLIFIIYVQIEKRKTK